MPSAKSGNKKLSKAEKEKKKREDEERKRQEEEEERIRQEQEARERRKREKTEAEERKKREKEELKIRIVQLAELRTLLGSFHQSLDAYVSDKQRQKRWDRYLRCDGSPDPTVLPQINTYMNVWRDENGRVLVDDVLEDSKLCLSLIEELEDYLEEENDAALKEQYRSSLSDLQLLLQEKLGRATYEMLRRGVTLADTETTNLQSVWSNDSITLCLWGNLSKNPRIKSFEFGDAGIGFDIPRALTKVGCAYQFLLTKFDHFSPQSPSYRAIPIVKEPTEPQVEEVPEETPEESEEPKVEEEPEAPAREPTLDLMAELQRADGEEAEPEPEPEPEEELETPEEDLCTSPLPVEFEDFDGEEDAMDLRGYHTIGPVMQFNILQIPPQPLERRGWNIVQHQDPPQPLPFDYKPEPIIRKDPEETPAVDADAPAEQPPPPQQQQQQQQKKPEVENPPITVDFKLPSCVFFAEEPKVARWDADRREWRTDGIEVTKFDEENRVLQFRTSLFGTLAFLQDFHINMPFQTWELRPLGTRSCQLNIVASINEVALVVKDDRICLPATAAEEAEENPEKHPEVMLGKAELKHLEGKWMSVKEMIRCLRAAGVNLFPREDSVKHVDVPAKSSIAENLLYEQMALLSSAMAFGWSRWNAENQDRDTLILQACEHLSDSPVSEDAFALYAFTRKHVRRLQMKEFDEEFSDQVDESVAFHADFYHLFQEIASDEAKVKVDEVDFHYLETVTELLKATRPLVFA